MIKMSPLILLPWHWRADFNLKPSHKPQHSYSLGKKKLPFTIPCPVPDNRPQQLDNPFLRGTEYSLRKNNWFLVHWGKKSINLKMSLKRQRENDISLDISCFGEEEIHTINSGNTTFTRGAFGELSIAIQQKDDAEDDNKCRFVAVKTIDRAVVMTSSGTTTQTKQQLDSAVFNELCALRHLAPHDNIVPLLAVFPSKSAYLSRTALCLVFPYAPVDLQMSLEWRRRSYLPTLPFGVIKTVSHALLSALAHCHSLGVIHRDIKPGNLLVTNSGRIQLCDFGLAKPITDKDKSIFQPVPGEEQSATTKGLCTLYYRPPEVLLGGIAANPAVDIYSTGIVIAELTTGTPLFTGQNVLDQLGRIFESFGTPTDSNWPTVNTLPDFGKLKFTEKSPKSWPEIAPRIVECPGFSDFLSRFLFLDPQKRCTSEDALEHEWLRSMPALASYSQIRNDLIPAKLDEPILIDPTNREVASKLALGLASTRRTFISKHGVSWEGASISEYSKEV